MIVVEEVVSMGAPMVYRIEVLVPGEQETRIVEVPAPNFTTAVMILGQRWPRVHLKKLHSSYVEGTQELA